MKTNHETSTITGPDAEASVARNQIHRQNRTGLFLPGFRTDSATEAVEAFLNQARAFDGGGVRLLDHRDQRMIASVEWTSADVRRLLEMPKRKNEIKHRDINPASIQLSRARGSIDSLERIFRVRCSGTLLCERTDFHV